MSILRNGVEAHVTAETESVHNTKGVPTVLPPLLFPA